jgi:hypothetical protein
MAGAAAGAAFAGAGKGAGVGAAFVADVEGALPLLDAQPHPVSQLSPQVVSQHDLQQSLSWMSLSRLRTGVHRGVQQVAQPASQPVLQPVAQPAFSQQVVFSQHDALGMQHSLAQIGPQHLVGAQELQAGSQALQAGAQVLQAGAHWPHSPQPPQSSPSTRLRISPLNPELHSDTLNRSDPTIVVTLISANSFSEKRGVLSFSNDPIWLSYFACRLAVAVREPM